MYDVFRVITKLFRRQRRRFLAIATALALCAVLGALATGGVETPPIRLELRFRDGVGIYAPQGAVTLDLVTHTPDAETGIDRVLPPSDVPRQIHFALYRLAETPETSGMMTPYRKRADQAGRELVVEQELALDISEPIPPLSFSAPAREGVYEIAVSLQRKGDWPAGSILNLQNSSLHRRSVKIVAEAVCQCLVVNPDPIPRPIGDWNENLEKELLETLDPSDPGQHIEKKRWGSLPTFPRVSNLAATKIPEMPKISLFRERPSGGFLGATKPKSEQAPSLDEPVASTLTDGLPRPALRLVEMLAEGSPGGSYGSGHLQIPDSASGGEGYAVLAAGESRDEESWEAFPLSVRELGRPHLLEIDYPDREAQSLGLSVVELVHRETHSQALLTADTGINVVRELVGDESAGRTATHRVLFWPKTKQPMLLLTNRDARQDARFGRIRLYRVRGKTNLLAVREESRLPQPFAGKAERLVAGYVHRPDFLRMPRETVSGNDDWTDLFEQAGRFLDAQRRSGYDGTMLCVASAESVLYPSSAIENTPGRLDALELLARLYDREQMTLIPAVDFTMPLTKLEDAIRSDAAAADEILCDDRTSRSCRYNLLHPLVREAMLDVIREIARRYGEHPSFGGVAVLLTPEGYAQLPDGLHGLDHRTIGQFTRETGQTPPTGVTDLAAWTRYFQSTPAVAEAWMRWRTQKVTEFHAQAAAILTEIRSDALLYLAGGTMLDGEESQAVDLPISARRGTSVPVLRRLGYDPEQLSAIPSLILLRPKRQSAQPDATLPYADFSSAEFNELPARFGSNTGVLFFHDALPGHATLPTGDRNRRRFVKLLAQADTPRFFDGGRTTAQGGEEHLADMLAAFRRLPVTTFETWTEKNSVPTAVSERSESATAKSLQPVTVRSTRTPAGLVVYLLNDAPFPVRSELVFSASTGATLVEIGGRRPIEPMTVRNAHFVWSATLRPYDFLAVRLTDPTGTLDAVDVARPEEICGDAGELKQLFNRFAEHIRSSRNGITWDELENPGCESTSPPASTLSGWQRFGVESFSARFDPAVHYSGRSSLKLTATSAVPGESGSVFSNPFPAPPTGRLFTSIMVGVPESTASLPMNVFLTGTHCGEPFTRSFHVGSTVLALMPKAKPTGGVRWQRIIVPFDRLPKDGLDELRIGIELAGSATAWIDEVTLYQVAFTKEEMNDLFMLLSAADIRLASGRFSDLMAILEGPAAQFLFQHVPSPGPANVAVAPPPVPAKENKAYTKQVAPDPVPPAPTPSVLDRVKSWFGR